MRSFITCILLLVSMLPSALANDVGSSWSRVRGDLSPGLSYTSFVATQNGRWIAAGRGGRLMISDDAGSNWRYDAIKDQSGRPIIGHVTDLMEVNGAVVGLAVSLVKSSNRFGLPFEGRTQVVSSSDSGTTWTVTDFPVREVTYGGGQYPGVFLTKLFRAPSGELVAYGTTLLSNGATGYFIGGAIFRQTGPGWTQAYFGLGMLQSMAQTGSRVTATGFQSILDSPDGAAWNGYALADSNISVDGEVLAFDLKEGLNASDVTFINSNTVIQTQLFKRSETNPNVFEIGAKRAFILESPNPFDGGRNWTGTELDQVYPNWLKMTDRLVSIGFSGADTSSSGADWTTADDSVRAGLGSFGPVTTQTVVSVGNSDEVWRSDNRGQAWTKILDQDPGPNFIQLVRAGAQILGREGNARIWGSTDNGATWTQLADIREQTGRSGITQIRARGDRLFAAQGETPQIISSSDGGSTWNVLNVPSTSDQVIGDVVIGQGGRLIIAPESRGISPPETDFYTSDDDGQTWVPRRAPLGFGETPKKGIHAGGGRIMFMLNGFASFDPELVISDDNGVTWRREKPFDGLDGLNTVSGDPSTKVIDLMTIFRTRAGRLIILGDSGELLTSDDSGDTWVVRINREADRGDGPFLDWSVFDIVESGGRLVVPASRRVSGSNSTTIPFAFVSGDDGTTWRDVPIAVEQSRTNLFSAVVAADGRVVLAGSNAAVYVSEPPEIVTEDRPLVVVREGETLSFDVQRPPSEGDVRVTYRLTPGSADEGADYVPIMGELVWSGNDVTPKTIEIETVDDLQAEQPEDFLIELVSDGELIVAFSYRAEIQDNEATAFAGIDVLSDGAITTVENGPPTSFRVVLTRAPTDTVTLAIANDDPSEVAVQPAGLTFTTENWNQPQSVQASGLDDAIYDRDVTITLTLTPTSADVAYNDVLPVFAYVTNLDDDELIFSNSFE